MITLLLSVASLTLAAPAETRHDAGSRNNGGPAGVSVTWIVDRPLSEIAPCVLQHATSVAAHVPPGMVTNGITEAKEHITLAEVRWLPGEGRISWRVEFNGSIAIGRRCHAVTGWTTGEASGEAGQTTFTLTTHVDCQERGFVPMGIRVFGPGRVLGWEREQLQQLTEASQ